MNKLESCLLVIIIILLIILIYKTTGQENAYSVSNVSVSTEALANIASIYADTKLMATFNNINVTSWKGMIVSWSGTITSIPTGWGLCDGTLGTPDLRGRFVLGYNADQPENNTSIVIADTQAPFGTTVASRVGSPYSNAINSVGGEPLHKLTIDEMPTHDHKYRVSCSGTQCGLNGGGLQWGGNYANARPMESDDQTQAGGSKRHNILPPYLVLAYIMKL